MHKYQDKFDRWAREGVKTSEIEFLWEQELKYAFLFLPKEKQTNESKLELEVEQIKRFERVFRPDSIFYYDEVIGTLVRAETLIDYLEGKLEEQDELTIIRLIGLSQMVASHMNDIEYLMNNGDTREDLIKFLKGMLESEEYKEGFRNDSRSRNN